MKFSQFTLGSRYLLLIPFFVISWPTTKLAASVSSRICNWPPKIEVISPSLKPILVKSKPKNSTFALKSGWKIQGLTIANKKIYYDIIWGDNGRWVDENCEAVEKIIVKVGQSSPIIWLSPELRRNSCAWYATLNHELEHVGNYSSFVISLTSEINKALAERLSKKKLKMNQNGGGLRKNIEKSVGLELAGMRNSALRVISHADGKIDTPENYRKILSECEG